MKTTKIFLAFVATAIIASLTVTTFAMWNGNWQGQWMWKWQWQWQGQHQGQGNRQWQQTNKSSSSKSHSPSSMLNWVATWSLSEQEKLDLAYQYSEEMVARDAYNYFYSLYGIQTFANIASSEQEHMDAVKVLLDRYSLPLPTWYGELQDEFNTLKAEWEISAQKALEAGLKIEMLDIEDIADTIKSTDNDDIKIVFTNIWGASYNHLRGFAKWLENAWYTTEIDFSKYLSQEQVDSKWTLKYLLAEKLANVWVSLPSQASSSNIKANCEKEEANQKARENYKKQIWNKYGNSLKKMSEEKLQTIDSKLDDSIEKVENNTWMTDKIKEKTLNVYYALKDYIAWLFR